MSDLRKCCGTHKGHEAPHADKCQNNPKNQGVRTVNKSRQTTREETEPDWSGTCEVCGQSPVVPLTGMCGPCTFGEADTVDGNW